MGYRSSVYLKTTTEGWLIMKRFNDKIEKLDDKPLAYAEVNKSPDGFYKISYEDLKWYDTYTQVQNFNKVLHIYESEDIPYSFIRIGEDTTDLEFNQNYTADMPDEIAYFEPYIELNDRGTEYDRIMYDGKECPSDKK